MTTGQEFVANYAKKGLTAWEAAALALAKQDELTPWPWIDLTLQDGEDTVILKVQSDVLSIGPREDFVRLPLTPGAAQGIVNLFGGMLTTPWLEYQIWRNAGLKLPPTGMVPNKGADLDQYLAHSKVIDGQIANAGQTPGNLLTAGQKKGVVVANFYKPGKVLIFGWYRDVFIPNTHDWGSAKANASARLSGPATDIFDDGNPMEAPNGQGGWPNRQPVQPKSNVHGDFYVDYSHGIRIVGPVCMLNGQAIPTPELYQHPTYSRLVSNEGPLKVPRYPSPVPPAPFRPMITAQYPAAVDSIPGVPLTPGATEVALDEIARKGGGG